VVHPQRLVVAGPTGINGPQFRRAGVARVTTLAKVVPRGQGTCFAFSPAFRASPARPARNRSHISACRTRFCLVSPEIRGFLAETLASVDEGAIVVRNGGIWRGAAGSHAASDATTAQHPGRPHVGSGHACCFRATTPPRHHRLGPGQTAACSCRRTKGTVRPVDIRNALRFNARSRISHGRAE
jgi:hypothetical protein